LAATDKPLIWLEGEVKSFGLPLSRPMPVLGARCHELRINDEGVTWRIMYRADVDAIVILDVFAKKTQATPKSVIDACKRRQRRYDALTRGRT
jgi:phage-related protein